VIYAIIFKSDLPICELPVSWKLGLDITCDADDHSKVMAGGPTCTYLGKQTPCFFGTSPKASITSTLLVDMLAFLDSLGMYDCSIASPFLLLDGHRSRMRLPFLKYVNDPISGIAVLVCQMPPIFGRLEMQVLSMDHSK
jgi:hypothetical protein